MRHNTLFSEEERSRAGRFHLYTQIAENATRPRKRPKPDLLTELGFDWVACLIIAFAAFGTVGIARGIGPVLRAHGL